METTVPEGLTFNIAPERLDEGSVEERAAFGLFTIRTSQQSLTEGFDYFLNGYRDGPLISGYPLAEWLAWNWWRLRFEPRSNSPDWPLAHRLTSIGEGYVWPNIEIWSDGVRTMLVSAPSDPDAKPFRYVGAHPTIVPSTLFEAAIDEFVPRILGRLRADNVEESNLDRLWRDILAERADPRIFKRRRLEALMGRDPDSIEDNAIESLIQDAALLGEDGIEEIAAELARTRNNEHALLTADALQRRADNEGFEAALRDMAGLTPEYRLPSESNVPAWKMGAIAAQALRSQSSLGSAPISDTRLAQMAGTTRAILEDQAETGAGVAFALDDARGQRSRLVMTSKRNSGRRFALARLIGDRIMHRAGALHPATHAYTYRQKAQRSFAAEFLSPFEAVDAMLHGDFSSERQHDVAEHFSVSPMVVNTLLMNHGRLERDEGDEEFFAAVA